MPSMLAQSLSIANLPPLLLLPPLLPPQPPPRYLPLLFYVLWHFHCAKCGFFQALSDLPFRRLSSPQVLMLPLSGLTFLRHNAQAASMAEENTPANALAHMCPHTAYCSTCVRIPGKRGQGKQTRKRRGKRCCCCCGSCAHGATGARQSLSRGGRLVHQSCARRLPLLPL